MYIDHYEIQSRRCNEYAWEHVGNVYPAYEWEIYRPWYFLGLVKRARPTISMLNAAIIAVIELHQTLDHLDRTGEEIRVLAWIRSSPNKPAVSYVHPEAA